MTETIATPPEAEVLAPETAAEQKTPEQVMADVQDQLKRITLDGSHALKYIEESTPPNFAEVAKQFPLTNDTVFTYGETLHNPNAVPIDNPLFMHENTHAKRQAAYEGGAQAWWARYLTDEQFRYDEEVVAYAAQAREYYKTHRDRNARATYVIGLARILTSGLYRFEKLDVDAGKAYQAITAKAPVNTI